MESKNCIERTDIPLEIGKKGIAALLIGTLIVAFVVVFIVIRLDKPDTVDMPEINVEAFNVVKSMGTGWNLGNALDTIDNRKRGILNSTDEGKTPEEHYETYWRNPVTTPEIIANVAQMGFGAVRVPVTYADHLYEDFTIREEWLKRVEEVVNYVLDNNMYCIINLHHDSGKGNWPWLRADLDNIDWLEERLAIVWAQIAERFKDYGDKLIFEGFNEILDTLDRWTNSNKAAYTAVNRLNQTFVDTVRNTGGNNTDRYLIVKTYAASREKDVLNAFVIPNDNVEGRLIAGIHYYGTKPFVEQQEEIMRTTTYSDWEYERDGKPMEEMLKQLKTTFIDKGVPVILCEFGAKNKNNTSDRVDYAVHYVKAAKQYGIACFWWDDGGWDEAPEVIENFALLNRHTNEWLFPEIAEAIVNAAK